jgi:hypothetical protein
VEPDYGAMYDDHIEWLKANCDHQETGRIVINECGLEFLLCPCGKAVESDKYIRAFWKLINA